MFRPLGAGRRLGGGQKAALHLYLAAGRLREGNAPVALAVLCGKCLQCLQPDPVSQRAESSRPGGLFDALQMQGQKRITALGQEQGFAQPESGLGQRRRLQELQLEKDFGVFLFGI